MSYKWWLFAAILLFGIGLIWGLTVPADVSSLFSEEVAGLGDLADFLSPLPQTSIFVFILVKNISVVLISFAFSPFFCLVPVMALVINGGVLGFVSVLTVQEKSLGYLLAGLLPHGILELPALILGEAAAFSFGTAVILALFRKERRKLLVPNLRQNIKYLVIAFALLLPAAIIETYVTPLFLN